MIIIRHVLLSDVKDCVVIEEACFPASEAANAQQIAQRATVFAAGFLVAEQEGKIVGMINSGATNADDLADEELKQLIGHDPNGHNLVVFSLVVAPHAQRQGIASKLMQAFLEQARQLGKQQVLLLCKAELVPFYQQFGFADRGVSASTHGGAVWHDMACSISA